MARLSLSWLALTVLVATVVLHPPPPEPRIGVRVRPRIMAARGDLEVMVTIPARPDNARFAVAWAGTNGFSGSTQRAVDGVTQAPIWIRNAPRDAYYITAAVFDTSGKLVGQDSTTVITGEDDR